MKIDGQKSKPEILEDYLNTIYYGRGAYGIQSGARAYFGKDVSKLTVPEGAVLASVINAPSLYDPANGDKAEANLQERFDYVLDGMVEQGWLSADERATYAELPKMLAYKGNKFSSGPNGYVTAAVKKELISTGLTDQDIDKGGLRIITTIDKKAQNAAIASMKDNLPAKVQGGLVAIRPGDGAVVAMYGGADYAKNQFNSATTAIMQGASNFKPFAVLAAVRAGISTKTKFDGDQPQEIDGTKITNFGERSYGMVDMRRMVGRSINTAFVNLNKEVTPAKTRQAAVDAGIPAKTPGMDDTLTNVLGTASPPRHRHGHGLLDDRLAGGAQQALPHHQGHLVRRRLRLRGQAGDPAGLRQGRHCRRHGRDDLHRQGRWHRHEAAEPRAAGRRQDRHLLGGEVHLVLRVRPPSSPCRSGCTSRTPRATPRRSPTPRTPT